MFHNIYVTSLDSILYHKAATHQRKKSHYILIRSEKIFISLTLSRLEWGGGGGGGAESAGTEFKCRYLKNG